MSERIRSVIALAAVAGAALTASSVLPAASSDDPFRPLAIYDGQWDVRATHPWGGGPAGTTDRLTSRCHRYTRYFACEQTVNDTTVSLIVYTAADSEGRLNTRTIAPNGLAGSRGDLTLAGAHWTYLDKPPAPLKGDWSRTENTILDRDHIEFAEYASSDEGKTWRLANSGTETRVS